MDVLSKQELSRVSGGSATVAILAVLGGLIIFSLGVFCGFSEK